MNSDPNSMEPVTKKVKLPNVTEDSNTNGNLMIEDGNEDDNTNEVVLSSACSETPTQGTSTENNENDDNVSTHEEDPEDDSHLFPFPPDNDINDMLEEVKYNGLFPTITDRYFTKYYKLNSEETSDDICILLHSNRICMLSLAPSHTLYQPGKQITEVNFKVSDKLDRATNRVSGKSKHGAQPLQECSNICIISCSNNNKYKIKCCVAGKLVEVNERLMEHPELLLEPPHRGGYLAILLPNIKHLNKMKQNLLTQEQYDLAISKRTPIDTTHIKQIKSE